jgi:hypothetical protein
MYDNKPCIIWKQDSEPRWNMSTRGGVASDRVNVPILTQDDEGVIVRIGEGGIGEGLRNGSKTSVANGSATPMDEGRIKMEGARQTQTRLCRRPISAAALSPVQMGTMYGTIPPNADADARKSVTASLGFCPDGQRQTISIPNLQMPEGSGPQVTPVLSQATPVLPQATPVLPPDAETEAHPEVTASLEFGIDSATASLEFDSLTGSLTPGVGAPQSSLPENGLMLDCFQEDWPVLAPQEEGLMLDCGVLEASPWRLKLAATQKRRPSLQASELADVVRVPVLQEGQA